MGKAAKPAVRVRPVESSCAAIQRQGFHSKLYLFQSPQERREGQVHCLVQVHVDMCLVVI